MVVSALAAIAVAGVTQDKLSGVWATRENRAIVFDGQSGTFNDRDRFGCLDFERKTPDGKTWYAWTWGPDPDRKSLAQKILGGSTGVFKGVTPENSKAAGWMKYTAENASKGDARFEFASGGLDWSSTITKIGTISDVWFDGIYSYDAMKVEATFDKDANVDGTMYINAERYVFKGKFGASFGKFRLLGYSNGVYSGDFSIQWAPTADFVAAMRGGKVGPGDQLLAHMKLFRKQEPNEYRALLKRTGSIR